MTHLECNIQMRAKISHQGGLQFHESDSEVRLSQSNFFPLPNSFQTTPVTHPHSSQTLRLQPQIRHPIAAWSSPTKYQDRQHNSAPDLQCKHDLGSSDHPEDGWLALLGPHQGPFTSVAAVGRQALGSVGPNPRATLVDQSRYHRPPTQPKKRQLRQRLYGRTKPVFFHNDKPLTPAAVRKQLPDRNINLASVYRY